MQKKIFYIFFLFTSIYVNAQNLIPNPSFEEYLQLPDSSNHHIYLAVPWVSSVWPIPGAYAYYFYELTFLGIYTSFHKARTGLCFAGLYHYCKCCYERTNLEVKLTAPLEKGKKYCISFYVSLDGRSPHAVGNFGAYFSPNFYFWPYFYIHDTTITPNFKVSSPVITDTLNWIKISGSFVAQGGEEYVTIQNFDDDNNTNVVQLVSNPSSVLCSGYYYDDIAVYPCDAPVYVADAGPDQMLCPGDSILIGSHNLPQYLYAWFVSPNLSDTLSTQARIWVKPDTTVTYVLKVKDFKFDESMDSVTIRPQPEPEKCIPKLIIPNVFTPNADGYNDRFEFQFAQYWNIQIDIFNRWGKPVFSSSTYIPWDGNINGQPAPEGVYFFRVTASADKVKPKQFAGSVTLLR